jgi:hypothetical protein
MDEHIYTIPINDAFDRRDGCPMCAIWEKLESDSLEYALGAAMMEPDVRVAMNKLGFCGRHLSRMISMKDRLPLALILESRLMAVCQSLGGVKPLSAGTKPLSAGTKLLPAGAKPLPAGAKPLPAGAKPLGGAKCDMPLRRRGRPWGRRVWLWGRQVWPWCRRKGGAADALLEAARAIDDGCFVCSRVDGHMARCFSNLIHMWRAESEFRSKFAGQPCLCVPHFRGMLEAARDRLSADERDAFARDASSVCAGCASMALADVSTFCKSFDYRNAGQDIGSAAQGIESAASFLAPF